MIAQIKIRRGTTAEWAAASPVVLTEGEPGWDSTLKGMKVGDGSTEWAALPWIDAKNRPDINAATLDGNTITQLKLLMYPVGSIYMSVSSTSPATLFGGTWSALGGRFLLGANGTYTAGSTGGAATHTLTNAELAPHYHDKILRSGDDNWLGYYGTDATASSGIAGLGWGLGQKLITGTAGGGNAHNNMPPYLVVYMWERTA